MWGRGEKRLTHTKELTALGLSLLVREGSKLLEKKITMTAGAVF
jgi:hypothetical protein